jgi:hypothetical protein
MSQFILPDPIAAQLHGLPHGVHLFDPSGKKLGYFVPANEPADDDLDPGLSSEELRRIETSTHWHTTDEVRQHLERIG